MEFAVLTAGVDPGRKLREKIIIDQPPEKRRVELRRVDAHDNGFEPEIYELTDQGESVAFPDGIHSEHRVPGEQLLAIGPDLFEKQIAKCNRVDPAFAINRERFTNFRLVLDVAGAFRNQDLVQRNSEADSLPLQQDAPHAVHAA